MKLAQKHCFAKARVAVARKLAVMMHVIWMKNQEFRWDTPPQQHQQLLNQLKSSLRLSTEGVPAGTEGKGYQPFWALSI
jgi:hypothetical protein